MSSTATVTPTGPVATNEIEQGTSLWHDAWLRLRKNKLAVFGMFSLALIALACLVGPLISPHGYEQQEINLGASAPFERLVLRESSEDSTPGLKLIPFSQARDDKTIPPDLLAKLDAGQEIKFDTLETIAGQSKVVTRTFRPTSERRWLGTDTLGRDLLVRLLFGGRVSLGVGLAATFVALTIGVVYGAVAGFFGGKRDAFMMRTVDIMYSLPFPIFVILLMVFFGRNIILLFVAIGAVEWLTMARIVRSQVMAIKKMEFIEAARSLGFGRRRIIFRHILPNILGPIIVYTTLTIPAVMLLEAFLSFLGLGVQPPMSSWGVLIKDGAEKMEEFPWLLIFPGVLFSWTLFSLNFLGDGLRDALDVRSSKD